MIEWRALGNPRLEGHSVVEKTRWFFVTIHFFVLFKGDMTNKGFGPFLCFRLERRDSMNQTTIQRVVTCSGIGLHSGNKVYLALRPASANTGIIFDIHTPDGIRRVSPAPKPSPRRCSPPLSVRTGPPSPRWNTCWLPYFGLGIDNPDHQRRRRRNPDYGRLRCGVSGTVRRSRHP